MQIEENVKKLNYMYTYIQHTANWCMYSVYFKGIVRIKFKEIGVVTYNNVRKSSFIDV